MSGDDVGRQDMEGDDMACPPDALSRKTFVTVKRPTGRPQKHANATERQRAKRARDKANAMLAADILFPYHGGKATIAPVVWERLGTVKHHVEPFAGSAAVSLQCPERLRHVTLNDQYGHLINTFRALQHAAHEVATWADCPASAIELEARSRRLYDSLAELEARLREDHRYYNAELAGLWIWAMSARMPTRLDKGLGHGKEYLQMTTAGGMFAAGKRDRVPAICRVIQAKLRGARLPCGDWRDVLTETVLQAHGHPVGVFLDPPYDRLRRDNRLYAQDSVDAQDVRQWAIAHGDDPRLRIALCGLEDEHAMPAGWTAYHWRTRGGMSNTAAHGRGSGATRQEVVWFSPHCLQPAQLSLLQEDKP